MAFGADISETLGNVGTRATAHGYNQPDEIRKQYTGYEHDDESGLDFAQARYYNATHGRFTSIDPLTASANVKDPQTFNRYTYAMNSPYKFTDPLGLISSSTNASGNDPQTRQQCQCCCEPKKKTKKQTQQKVNKPTRPKTNNTNQDKPSIPQKSAEPQKQNDDSEDEVIVTETDKTTSGDSNKIGNEIAKKLNEGYQKEQALIQGAVPKLGATAVKAFAKELGETFNPTASGGTDSSVKIDVPSPGPIIAEVVGAAAEIGSAIIQNRIDTQTQVNVILMNADVDMQGAVDETEIKPTLEQARQIGLDKHNKAKKRNQ